MPRLFIILMSLPALLCADECCPLVLPQHQVTLPEAHRGTLEIDTLLLDSYGKLPEARRNFYLTARKILGKNPEATLSHPDIIKAASKPELPLMSGPMLGDLRPDGVTVWFRSARPEKLRIRVSRVDTAETKNFPVPVSTPGVAMRVPLSGLEADTNYKYQLIDPEASVLGEGFFQTASNPGSRKNLRVAFGSCMHKIGFHNPNLMQQITKRGNQAMLLLGDLAVDDREAKLSLHTADYLLRDVSKAWRKFSASMPIYASWDDHDYLNNDKSGLQKGQITDEQRNDMRAVWQENWNNPPTPVKNRGIYFSTRIGDVELIMLDTRSCRDWERRGELNSYLGETQMEWLFKTLEASEAKFIILTSGTMWSDFMSNAKDSWGTWDIPGREAIFNFIESKSIDGVVLLSGDRHGARGFRIERPTGYAFYEFEVATLGTDRGPRAFAPDESTQFYGYKGGLIAFGELTFEMERDEPQVVFRLIVEDGSVIEEHTVSLAELTPQKE
ncbi:MAG: alkaline phosphatase D family protein [Verrucomicrobiota bacterium]